MERVLLVKRVARKSTFSARLGFVRSSDFEATKSSTCSSARKSKSKRSEQAPSKSSASLATAQKHPNQRLLNLVVLTSLQKKTCKRDDESATESKIRVHLKKWCWYDRGVKIHQANKFRKGAFAK
ncbi:hypothetical protein YC2023_013855 [Brassica napus]